MSDKPLPRSKGAMMFMAAPIFFGGLLFLAVGLLAFLVWIGSEADGDRVRMLFEGECMEKATPFINQRVNEIGLGDVLFTSQENRLEITATLPSHEKAEEMIPNLLVQKGVLSVRDKDEWLSEHLSFSSVGLAQDEAGMPYAQLVLEEGIRKKLEKSVLSDPKGFLYFFLDGTQIAERPNHNLIRSDELRLRSIEGGKKQQLKTVVDWSIVLAHGPLPCEIAIVEVSPILQ